MDSFNLLTASFDQLPVSGLFKRQCREMGFGKLEDILRLSPAALRSTPGFSYRWLGELSDLLAKNGLLHLLQPIQGRSFG